MNLDGYVKIGLPIEGEEGSNEWVWATVEGPGRYKIDNLPWFSRSATYEDVVSAQPDEHGMMRFKEILERGPYGTVTLVFSESLPEVTYKNIINTLIEDYEADVERGMAAMYALVYPEALREEVMEVLDWYYAQGFLHAYA